MKYIKLQTSQISPFINNIRLYYQRFFKNIKVKGIRNTIKKTLHYLSTRTKNEKNIRKHLSKVEIYAQRNKKFKQSIKFSILVPLYNTQRKYFGELVNSILDQTYSNWELCLADGSDENNNQIYSEIQKYKNDQRIKYLRLEGNRGIALNTLAAYEISSGDFIVLLDHDDILAIDALFELALTIEVDSDSDILYSDRAIFDNTNGNILAFHYLPGFSPDYLRSMNYMSHLIAFSKDIISKVGFERPGFEGSQDYEFLLRCVENAIKIHHIPKVLYLCRAAEGSVAKNPEAKFYAYENGRIAISEHIQRIGYPGNVVFLPDLYAYRINYDLSPAHVSIVILNKDHEFELSRCITSILRESTYQDFEIIIVENNSQENKTFRYYESLKSNKKIRVIEKNIESFNYSSLNNYAVNLVNSEYVLLLNNDTEVISPSWIEEMLMFAQRKDVGAVGAKLLYPDGLIQHCGLVIGLKGSIASHHGYKKPDHESGYMNTLSLPQNYSAVTGACLLVKKQDYLTVGGLDEDNFSVGLNDIDFCLKLREKGLLNVWTPYAKLYHFESMSRGSDTEGGNRIRYEKECSLFKEKWEKYFMFGDPFDTINFMGW